MSKVHIDVAGLADRLEFYEDCWYGYLRTLRQLREKMA